MQRPIDLELYNEWRRPTVGDRKNADIPFPAVIKAKLIVISWRGIGVTWQSKASPPSDDSRCGICVLKNFPRHPSEERAPAFIQIATELHDRPRSFHLLHRDQIRLQLPPALVEIV